jgi:hypothetical protein
MGVLAIIIREIRIRALEILVLNVTPGTWGQNAKRVIRVFLWLLVHVGIVASQLLTFSLLVAESAAIQQTSEQYFQPQ